MSNYTGRSAAVGRRVTWGRTRTLVVAAVSAAALCLAIGAGGANAAKAKAKATPGNSSASHVMGARRSVTWS